MLPGQIPTTSLLSVLAASACEGELFQLRQKGVPRQCFGISRMHTLATCDSYKFSVYAVQATCLDTRVANRSDNATFECPTGLVLNPATLFSSPPTRQLCCLVRLRSQHSTQQTAGSFHPVLLNKTASVQLNVCWSSHNMSKCQGLTCSSPGL